MTSPYDTSEILLGRIGLKSPDTLGEQPLSQLARALVDKDNRLAFYVNHAGQLVAADGTVVVAGNTTVDFITVANATARLALTTATVRNGDHVKETDTGNIYELVNDTAISTAGSWVKLKAIVAADIVDSTAAGRALLTAAAASTQRAAMGLGSAATADASEFVSAGHTLVASDIVDSSAAGQSLLTAEDYPQQRQLLDVLAERSWALPFSQDASSLGGMTLVASGPSETWNFEYILFVAAGYLGHTLGMSSSNCSSLNYVLELTFNGIPPLVGPYSSSVTLTTNYGLFLLKIRGTVVFDESGSGQILPYCDILETPTSVLAGSYYKAQRIS